MLISICIPTYSRLNYLKQAVQSAKSQTYEHIEICISQNPKKQGADVAIQEWCEHEAANGNLIYNLNKNNLGLAGNLNVLAKLATGAYLIFLGDDDLLHVDYVKELINRSKNVNPDVIFSNQFFVGASGDILDDTTLKLNSAYKRDGLREGVITDAVQCVFQNSVALSASLIKKELFNTYSFSENLNTPELPFFLKIALNNGIFFYLDRQLAYYRLHKNSETNNGLATDELLKEIIAIQTPLKYKNLKKKYIEQNIIPSINKSLSKGNYKLASLLLNSGYYPKKPLIKAIQQVMSLLPVQVVRIIFRFKKAVFFC